RPGSPVPQHEQRVVREFAGGEAVGIASVLEPAKASIQQRLAGDDGGDVPVRRLDRAVGAGRGAQPGEEVRALPPPGGPLAGLLHVRAGGGHRDRVRSREGSNGGGVEGDGHGAIPGRWFGVSRRVSQSKSESPATPYLGLWDLSPLVK